MKYLCMFTFVSIAVATVSIITLLIKSDYTKVNNYHINSNHDDPITSHLYVTNNQDIQYLQYDSETGIIYRTIETNSEPLVLRLTIDGSGVYKLKQTDYPLLVSISDDGKLEFDGDEYIYVAKNLNGPYEQFQNEYILTNLLLDETKLVDIYVEFINQNWDNNNMLVIYNMFRSYISGLATLISLPLTALFERLTWIALVY